MRVIYFQSKFYLRLALFSMLFFLVSRGLLNIFFGDKITAYVFSCVIPSFLLFFCFVKIRINFNTQSIFLLWVGCSGISVVITQMIGHGEHITLMASLLYFSIMLTIVFLILFLAKAEFHRILNINDIALVTAIVGSILYTVSILQQIDFVTLLPGMTLTNGDRVRPSSLLGSYLHYPIVIFLLAAILLQYCFKFNVKNNKYFFVSIVLILSPLFSYSRSGDMLIISSIFFYFVLNIKASYFFYFRNYLLFFLLLLLSMLIFFFLRDSFFFERAVSAINPSSPGNPERIESWTNGIYLWLNGNILFGGYTGFVTNSTANILHQKSIVFESSFIQQLCNFGLLGTVFFYAIMLYNTFNIDKECKLLIAVSIAVILQTFVLQSIEIFPYMFIYSMLPMLSKLIVGNKPSYA